MYKVTKKSEMAMPQGDFFAYIYDNNPAVGYLLCNILILNALQKAVFWRAKDGLLACG